MKFIRPKQYKYTPQKDITAYEVALLLPIATGGWMDLKRTPNWEEIKRHFTEIK